MRSTRALPDLPDLGRVWAAVGRLALAAERASSVILAIAAATLAAAFVLSMAMFWLLDASVGVRILASLFVALSALPGLYLLWWQNGLRAVSRLPDTVISTASNAGADVISIGRGLPEGRILAVVTLAWRARRSALAVSGATFDFTAVLKIGNPFVLAGVMVAIPWGLCVVFAVPLFTAAWIAL